MSDDNNDDPISGIGHNSRKRSTVVSAQKLRSFVERIERLNEEKSALQNDIKEVYAEAKGTGFDTKAIRKLVAIRKKDATEREEEDAILELYKSALGMI